MEDSENTRYNPVQNLGFPVLYLDLQIRAHGF
jgi:hypothetical protein